MGGPKEGTNSMPQEKRIFYAYPSTPLTVGETVQSTIERLRSNGELRRNGLRFRTWEDQALSGTNLIKTVLGNIDRAHVFACDLTYLNPNVGFELGYAIAKFKRIFCSLNSTIEDADRNYKLVHYPLLQMAYSDYDNNARLAEILLTEMPWNNLDQTLLDSRFKESFLSPEMPSLMYLKPPVSTDSVLAIQEELTKSSFGKSLIIDDPVEYSSQILDWYAEKLINVDALAVHLLSLDHSGGAAHNVKATIVAGLAHGFGIPILLLAHAPYESPVDYQSWLSVHETAESCVAQAKPWLETVYSGRAHRRARRPGTARNGLKELDLRSLFLGDLVAEHEAEKLYDYFVETSPYYQALRGPVTILVGRRGTGKTAILYAVRGQMRRNRNNQVTVLKPIGYETHGLVRVLQEVRERSERGFLIESLWKYLIYSEIGGSVVAEILSRTIYQPRSSEEESFIEYYNRNKPVFGPPFSERMQNAVASLMGLGDLEQAGEQRIKISESLHNSIINELRRHLGIVLDSKDSMTLLIDGLDEPWGPGDHVAYLSELIAGLLNVVQFIPQDFARSDDKVKPVETSISVLLRSDIFAFIQHLMPEQDKLPITQVTWNDRELLLRVLEERMLYGASSNLTAEVVWSELFPQEVHGMAFNEFLFGAVLPRPRDLIHLLKTAVSTAINRGHNKVLEADFVDARDQYSQYAFNSVLKEDDPVKGKLENVLYEFAGTDKILTRKDLESLFATAQVDESDFDFYIDLLCDINFLGIEVGRGFQFPRDEEDRRTIRNMARVIATRDGRSERFQLNPAFYPVLQIQ